MNLLTTIDEAIAALLETIDGLAVPSTTYTYKTITKVVDIEEKSLVDDSAPVGAEDGVSYVIYEDNENGETINDVSYGQNAYTNDLNYNIKASIDNSGDETKISRFAVRQKLNDVLSDLKLLFFRNNTLSDTCFDARITKSKKTYTSTNNLISSGFMVVELAVQYGQSGNNPDNKACEF